MAKVSELVFRVRADTKGVKQGMDPAVKSLKDADKAAQHLDTTLDKLTHEQVKITVQDEALRTARQRIDALKADIVKRVQLGMDTKQARAELRELEATVKAISGKTVRTRVVVDGTKAATAEVAELKAELLALTGLSGGLGKFVPVLAAIGAAAVSLDFGRDNEKLAASFNLVTKSATDTLHIMEAIDEIGTTRPIEMGGLEEAGLTLARFRVEASAIPGILSDLADTAIATGKPINDLATSVGQLTVMGEGQAKMLKGLERTGVPVYEALAEATGKSVSEAKALAKQGLFTQDAIRGMVRELGEMNKQASQDVAQTLDGQLIILRNRFGEVAESIGMDLLPATKGVGNAFAGVALALEKIPAPLIAIVIQLGLLAGAGKLVGLAMPAATRGVRDLGTAVGKASGGFGKFRAGLGGVMSIMGGPWGLAVGAGITVLSLFASGQAEAAAQTQEFKEQLDLQTGAINATNRAVVAKRLQDTKAFAQAKALGLSTSDYVDAILGVPAAVQKYDAAIARFRASAKGGAAEQAAANAFIGEATGQYDQLRGEIGDAQAELAEFNGAMGIGATNLDENASAAERLGTALTLTADGYKLVVKRGRDVAETAEDIADAYEAQHDAIDANVSAIQKLLTNLDILKNRSIEQKSAERGQRAADREAKTAMLDLADAQKDLNEARSKGAKPADVKRATFEVADASDRVAESLEAQAKANTDALAANLKAGKGQAYANQKYAEGHAALLKNIEASGIATTSAEDYATTLEDAPETVTTKFEQTGLDAILTQLEIIAHPIKVQIQAELTASFWAAKEKLDNMGRQIQSVPIGKSGGGGSAPRESGGSSAQSSNGAQALGASPANTTQSAFSGGGGTTTNLNQMALVGSGGTTVNVFVQDRKLVNLVDVTVSNQVQAAVLTVTRKRVITV